MCRHIFSVLTGAHLGVKSLGHLITLLGFPGGSVGKESACSAGDPVRSVGREGPLEKEMATPPQYSCLGNPMDRRTWWATVHGVARVEHNLAAAAAAAKSLQSCPTLCDPIDGSQPGSPIPGILQARVLEWAAISFSNA